MASGSTGTWVDHPQRANPQCPDYPAGPSARQSATSCRYAGRGEVRLAREDHPWLRAAPAAVVRWAAGQACLTPTGDWFRSDGCSCDSRDCAGHQARLTREDHPWLRAAPAAVFRWAAGQACLTPTGDWFWPNHSSGESTRNRPKSSRPFPDRLHSGPGSISRRQRSFQALLRKSPRTRLRRKCWPRGRP